MTQFQSDITDPLCYEEHLFQPVIITSIQSRTGKSYCVEPPS